MNNRNIHPLKTSYQYSILIGLLISTALVVLPICIAIYLTQPDLVQIDLQGCPVFKLKPLNTGGGEMAGFFTDESDTPGGPVRGYHVLPGGFKQPNKEALSANFRIVNKPEIYGVHGAGFASTTLPGILEIGSFDPGFDEYLNRPAGPKILRPIDYCPDLGAYGRGVKRERPLKITFLTPFNVTDPYNYMKSREVTDTVIVLMTIDNSGHITELVTVYDAHPELDFAHRFRMGLRCAWIEPEIVHGKEIGGTYPLYCIFAGKEVTTYVANTDNIEFVPPNYPRMKSD